MPEDHLVVLHVWAICCIFNRQKYTGNLEKQLATFKDLQERFRNVVNEKKKKESELQKASKEFEEAVSMLETCQTQWALLISVYYVVIEHT